MARPKEYPFLDKYLPRVKEFLLYVKDTKRSGTTLGAFARKIGVDQARLSDIIKGRRRLTGKWILYFVRGGYITVADFLKGKDESAFSEEESMFWGDMKIIEDKAMMSELRKTYAAGKRDTALKILTGLND